MTRHARTDSRRTETVCEQAGFFASKQMPAGVPAIISNPPDRGSLTVMWFIEHARSLEPNSWPSLSTRASYSPARDTPSSTAPKPARTWSHIFLLGRNARRAWLRRADKVASP